MENYLCIDLGGTNIRIGIISKDKKIIALKKEKSIHDDKDKLFSQIKNMIISLNYQNYQISCIGISLCGMEKDGVIIYAPNLRIHDLNLKSLLEETFNIKTKIVNDANAAALSEAKYGNHQGEKSIFFTTISTGLGIGLVYEDKLINLPLEAGHQLIEYKDKDYDVEHLLSGNGLVKMCSLNGLNVKDAANFFELVKNNDALAKKVLDDYTSLLAKFYYNQQVCYNCDCIILSGGMMKSKEFFVDELTNKANKLLENKPFKKIKFVDAKFDQDAGLFGACAVAEFYK